MSRFIYIKHKCFDCGCDLGFIDSIDKRNYQFYKGKYYCKECFEGKR
jgi:hypothetical protein